MVMCLQSIMGAYLLGIDGYYTQKFGLRPDVCCGGADRSNRLEAHSASMRWHFARGQTGGQRKDVSSSTSKPAAGWDGELVAGQQRESSWTGFEADRLGPGTDQLLCAEVTGELSPGHVGKGWEKPTNWNNMK